MTGADLIAWRTAKAWTITEAAHYWSVQPATYRRWERTAPPAHVATELTASRRHDAQMLTAPSAPPTRSDR